MTDASGQEVSTASDELLQLAMEGNANWSSYKRALEKGADVNALGSGRTALVWAICCQRWEIANNLLEVPGIDADGEDEFGFTPISMAISWCTLAFVQKLVSLGANPHHGYYNHATVLQIGCNSVGDDIYDKVEYLLTRCGCDPNLAVEGGQTALHFASQYKNNHRIIALLLDNGADIHARFTDRSIHFRSAYRNVRTGTALHIAAAYADRQVVQLLMDRGSRAEDKDQMGWTALHHAAARFASLEEREEEEEDHALEIVDELILRRADTLVRDNWDRTPFDLAWISGNTEICDLLLASYTNQLVTQHGPLMFHAILRSVEYLDATQDESFQVPLHPLAVRLPVASTSLTFEYFWNWFRTFDLEMIGNRDFNGDLPIHVACAHGTKVEVLRILIGLDPATLHYQNNTGQLPVHIASGSGRTDLEIFQFLVNEGGVGTLSARDQSGALPLHCLLGAQTNSSKFDAVQFFLQSFRGSASVATNEGQLPFVVASQSSCSLDVLFSLLKAFPEALALSISRRTTEDHENDSN